MKNIKNILKDPQRVDRKVTEVYPSSKELWNRFSKTFMELEGVRFSLDALSDLKPLIYYFSRNEKFFDCPNLVREVSVGGRVRKIDPSFKKGLMIVGTFGNGKSSITKALEKSFIGYPDVAFKMYSANEVVENFENCKDASDKNRFWKSQTSYSVCYDDLKTERHASNYGKVNLFKDVLEKRYSKRLVTHVTCNYKKGFHGDVGACVLELGDMYGNRVLDRAFEMFNIIEFKGKSFRR